MRRLVGFGDKYFLSPAIAENWFSKFSVDTTNDAGRLCEDDHSSRPGFGTLRLGALLRLLNAGVLTMTGTGTVSFQKEQEQAGLHGRSGKWNDYVVSTSVTSGHRIYEIYLDKGTAGGNLAMGYNNNVRYRSIRCKYRKDPNVARPIKS